MYLYVQHSQRPPWTSLLILSQNVPSEKCVPFAAEYEHILCGSILCTVWENDYIFCVLLYIAREQKYANCSRNDIHYVFINTEIQTSGICFQSQRNIYYNYTLKNVKNSIYLSNCGGFIFLRDINVKIT